MLVKHRLRLNPFKTEGLWNRGLEFQPSLCVLDRQLHLSEPHFPHL